MSFVAGIGYANCDVFYLGLPRLPREGEELYATGFQILPGGGVPATMMLLAQLGVPVNLATFLGRDEFSLRIERALTESGVAYHNLYDGDGMPVAVSVTAVTPNNRTFLSYRDDAQVDAPLMARAAALFQGAGLMELQIGMLDICRLVKAQNPSVRFVLDTGWLDDLSLESYREYLELADYYTPNRAEALQITGTDTPEKALAVLAKHFDAPIVKLDGEGCLVMRDGEVVLVPPLPGVQFVDATGAGDAFLAGLLYGLYHGRDIVDCVVFGNVAGGTCVQSIGCLTVQLDEVGLHEKAATLRAAWRR